MTGPEENTAPQRPTTVKCLVWDLDNTLWQGTLAEGDQVILAEPTRELITTLDARGSAS